MTWQLLLTETYSRSPTLLGSLLGPAAPPVMRVNRRAYPFGRYKNPSPPSPSCSREPGEPSSRRGSCLTLARRPSLIFTHLHPLDQSTHLLNVHLWRFTSAAEMAPTTLTWLGFSWRAMVLNEMYVYYKSPPMLAFTTSALSFSSFETFLVFCFPSHSPVGRPAQLPNRLCYSSHLVWSSSLHYSFILAFQILCFSAFGSKIHRQVCNLELFI